MRKTSLLNHSYHFIGIGGCGMSGLAAYLHLKGAKVTGSDLRKSFFTEELESIGVSIVYGHDENNVPECDTVVITSAVKADNPELVIAQKKGMTVIKRGHLLALLTSKMKTIAVAGSHGKTSTVSFITWMLHCAGIPVNGLVGGIMRNFNRNYVIGDDHSWFVIEADESDGSMQLIDPDILVLLNVDNDHIDHYGTIDGMLEAYRKLALKARSAIFVNGNDRYLTSLIQHLNGKTSVFQTSETYNINFTDIKFDRSKLIFPVMYQQKNFCDITFANPSSFYTTNFLAALSVAKHVGLPIEAVQQAALTFSGVKRRGELWGVAQGVEIYEDYAHHPTEISLMLESLKRWQDRRIICIFQPHRYTRSKHIAESLAEAFSFADVLILTDIYSADEAPIDGINGKFVYDTVSMRREKNCYYLPKLEYINHFLDDMVQPGDIVVFMGAGDIGKCASEYKLHREKACFA